MSRFPDSVVTKYAKAPQASLDSGSTNHNTEVDGSGVDLHGTTGVRYRRVRVCLPYSVNFVSTSTGGNTVTFASNLQHRETTSGTGSTWADFGTAPSNHVSSDPASTGTVEGVFEYEQDLTTAARYLRVQVTPTFASTTTGVSALSYSGHFTLMDPNHYPADTAP